MTIIKFKKILNLFLTFFKIGAFTFGGGYAMIALLENEFVQVKKWMTKDDFLDMVAIAESTPGPIAINSATFIGYRTAGVLGSAAATLGVCIPSFVIIFVISLFLDEFMSFRLVKCAFNGIQACVVYLIFSAAWKMFKGLKKTPLTMVLFGGVTAVMTAFSLFAVKFSSVFYILICGVIGIAYRIISKARGKDIFAPENTDKSEKEDAEKK